MYVCMYVCKFSSFSPEKRLPAWMLLRVSTCNETGEGCTKRKMQVQLNPALTNSRSPTINFLPSPEWDKDNGNNLRVDMVNYSLEISCD